MFYISNRFFLSFQYIFSLFLSFFFFRKFKITHLIIISHNFLLDKSKESVAANQHEIAMEKYSKTDVVLNYVMFNAIRMANRLEFFLIPVCVVFGLISNLTGSIAIFSSYQMRKRTPLFIVACIGMVDSLFLLTQAQRWFAVNFSNKYYLNNHSMCKLYFTLIRSSLLITVSLLFCMLFARFIRIFYGLFRLSVYSNLGQLLSKLSVAYVFALGLALSWHELWTSGLWQSTESQLNILLNEKTKLTCRKNPLSFFIIDTFQVVYFLITTCISLLLIALSSMMIIKIKRIKCFLVFSKNSHSERFSFNDIEPNSLYNNFSSSDCNELSQLNEKKEIDSSTQLNDEICEIKVENDSDLRPKPQASAENVNQLRVASLHMSKFKSFDHLNHLNLSSEIGPNRLKFSLPNLTASQSRCNSLLNVNHKPIKPSATTDFNAKFRASSFEPNTNLLLSLKAKNTKFHLNPIYLEKSLANRDRFFRFSSFLLTTSLFCSFFYLAYFLSDFFFYENAMINPIYDKDKFLLYNQSLNAIYHLYVNYYIKFDASNFNSMNQTVVNYRARIKYEETLISALFPDAIARLPLVLINIPHAIKFVLLFFFYAKFRHRLSYLMKMRLFVNWELAKRLLCDKKVKLKCRKKLKKESSEKTQSETKPTNVFVSSSTNENEEPKIHEVLECKGDAEEKLSIGPQRVKRDPVRITHFRFKKRIKFFNCFHVPSSEVDKKKATKFTYIPQTKIKPESSSTNRNSLLLKALKRYAPSSARHNSQRLKVLTRYRSEELLETSSILGYKSTVNNNTKNSVFNEDLYDMHNIFMSSLKINQKRSLI